MTGVIDHDWVDSSEAPLYVWRIPQEPDTEQLKDSLTAIQRWIVTLSGPYAWINDPRALRIQTVATQRQLIADHLRFVEPYSRRFCAGMATVAANAIVRGAGTAISWLYRYPFPTCFTTSFAQAHSWTRAQLDRCERLGSLPPVGRRRTSNA